MFDSASYTTAVISGTHKTEVWTHLADTKVGSRRVQYGKLMQSVMKVGEVVTNQTFRPNPGSSSVNQDWVETSDL